MNNKNIVIGVVAILMVVFGVSFLKPTKVINEINLPEIAFPVGATPGNDFTQPVIFREGITVGERVSATTTSTGTSATLVAKDLQNFGYHIVTFGGALNADFTYTLPASTTLASGFVPAIGARKEVCWFNNASSTSNHDLIFAAGTGIDLVHGTTTAPVPLGVGDDQTACIEFIRQPTKTQTLGDITAVLKLFADSD